MLAKLILPILPLLALAIPLEKKQNTVQIIENCYESGMVAATFDDGPYLYEGDVFRDLNGGKGTFFLNGNNYDCIYNRADQIREIYNNGHTMGSHTWSHAHLTQLDEAGINEELEKVETAFIKILGVKRLYFRPPYGEYNDLVLKVLSDRGYKKLFLWSDDTEDASGATVKSSEGVLESIIQDYPNSHMVLMHSVIETTSEQVLPWAGPQLQQKGYKLVSVDTCLGSSGEWPYQWIGEPQARDDSWTC